MIDETTRNNLRSIAKQMVAPGKGILAADESISTAAKRLTPIGLENTPENRRAFREMLLTAMGENQYLSGVILFDETIRQTTSSGKSFVEVLTEKGMLPGIKVDESTYPMPSSPTEKLTKGLDGLDTRLKEYISLGAVFCKWRAVITISPTTPTQENIQQNAKDLAAYAKLCQEQGLVPMMEPEVLMDGNHTREEAKQATEKILTALFEELAAAQVFLEGAILKTSMVITGKQSGERETPEDVAEATLGLFEKVIPQTLAGIVFLSGGQTELQATANLNAMHQSSQLPWPLTFSFARALQDSATKVWQGKEENTAAAQTIFLHRAKMNSLASLGKYSPDLENE